jgi:hypothetical protein
MATFKTSKDCFLGGVFRREGTTFSLDKKDVPEITPKWLEPLLLTPQQKAAITKAKNEAARKSEQDDHDISMEANERAKPVSSGITTL